MKSVDEPKKNKSKNSVFLSASVEGKIYFHKVMLQVIIYMNYN